MYSPLTERIQLSELVEGVELLPGARLLTIIEAVSTKSIQEICGFPFFAQIEGLTKYQPDSEDIDGYEFSWLIILR